jgi:SAM-dependent methyltransferase
MSPHLAIYAAPGLYDLAFRYRDFEAETRFLREAFRRRRGRAATSFFELAAGPGGHALSAASAGLAVTALDLSAPMAAYTLQKAERAGVELRYLVADMTSFEPPGTFDLAACLLCSAGYLLTDDAVLSHLASVRAALAPEGLYVLELTHPAELGGDVKSNHSWRVRDELGELEIDWRGDPGRAIDGIWESHVTLLYRPTDGSPPTRVEDVARERGFTFEQVERFAERSGFAVEATFGGFDEALPLAGSRASRMLVVLGRS